MNADGGYSMEGAGIRERVELPDNARGTEGVSGNAIGYPTAGQGTRKRVETRPIRAGRASEGLTAGGGTRPGVASRSVGPGYTTAVSACASGLQRRHKEPLAECVKHPLTGKRAARVGALRGTFFPLLQSLVDCQ
jgi:hypothetical protein